MPKIVVVGSLHTDLVITAPRLPVPGETLIGEAFHTFPGGKGANQAVAAARLGGEVWMVGRVGQDLYGAFQRESLQTAGVHTDFVTTDPAAASGVALITVAPGGENIIVVATGASGRCAPEDVDRAGHVLTRADVLLLQLEIPMETVVHAAHVARRHGVRVVLDPAPAQEIPTALWEAVDLITPNETEAAVLCGVDPGSPADPVDLALRLRQRMQGPVLITLGPQGVLLANDEGVEAVRSVPVQAVDATAAGDTFNGALAVALAEGRPLREAIRWANFAAALSVTRLGAQSSIPTRDEVERFIGQRW